MAIIMPSIRVVSVKIQLISSYRGKQPQTRLGATSVLGVGTTVVLQGVRVLASTALKFSSQISLIIGRIVYILATIMPISKRRKLIPSLWPRLYWVSEPVCATACVDVPRFATVPIRQNDKGRPRYVVVQKQCPSWH